MLWSLQPLHMYYYSIFIYFILIFCIIVDTTNDATELEVILMRFLHINIPQGKKLFLDNTFLFIKMVTFHLSIIIHTGLSNLNL